MFEAEESLNTDVESQVSSEPTQDTQPEAKAEGQEAQSTQPASQPTKEVPFHEHPRWKEVMEERNAEREARRQLEARIADMQRQFQEQAKPKQPDTDPMYERLKGIDPEFADYLKDVRSQAAIAKQLQEELTNLRQEQFVNSAQATFKELNTQNNVDPKLAKLYEQQLEAAYARGEFKDLGGLKATYQNIHKTFSELMGTHERQTLEKYTAGKKQDASKPASQPKGKPVSTAKGMEFSKNSAEARQQLIQAVLKQSRASSDV